MAMTDQEALELLRRIDDGYEPKEAEKKELASIKEITWKEVEKIPKCIGLMTGLKTLDVSGAVLKRSRLTTIPESIGNLSCLQRLDLSSTQITTLPESIGNLSNLQSLYLSYTKISTLPESIGNLSSLKDLDLSDMQISTLPESIGNLSSLEYLDLSYTQISTLPESIGNLSILQDLDLSYTQISTLPESIGNLLSLQSMNLRNSQIKALPEVAGDLSTLQFLVLENLTLFELPESLLKLNLEYKNTQYDLFIEPGVYIKGLKLQNQPIEVFSQEREVIVAYYKSAKQKSTSPINECKVVFLGDGGAGKSLIIDRLMKDGNKSPKFDGEATPGIKITSKKYTIDGDEIELHFWDFGGQAIMHSMHRLFLTNRTLYVVVTNARDNKANEQARYWIRNIRSFANGAPVFLLINQKDRNPSVNINETGLRKEYSNIKGVETVSALKDKKKEFNESIRDVICRIVSEMESVHTPFARSWLSLMNDLQEMPEDYIDSKDFRAKCRDNGIDMQQGTLDQIINWYKDLGVCFYSRKHPVARKYMVLKPRWLLNAIYILAFNGRKYAMNGILSEEDIHTLICEPVPDSDVKKVWTDIKYEAIEIQYIINVLLNFNLVYRIDNERFFVPMLCDENEPDIIDEFDTEEAIHVSFKYDYLPENVIHRLMVLRGDELNTEVVWKTGALFERKRCSWQALARIKDNCLDVYARAGDQKTHPINSYLDIIRESVYKINSDLGLAADEYITYSRDGKKDEFKYKKLEGRKRAGQNEEYSEVFDALISIDEITGAITSPDLLARGYEDEQVRALLSASADALLELQGDRHYFGAKENDCNKFVRALLKSAGYVCLDQTLQGVSETGKSDGELDILIQDRDRGDDIAIYEALKLEQKTFAKGDQEYLADHLKKLLDNYNPKGLTNLLLVSYVSWDKKQFDRLASEYMAFISDNLSAPYEIMESKAMDHLNASFIRCWRVRYDCGGISMYVYHFVVRVAA